MGRVGRRDEERKNLLSWQKKYPFHIKLLLCDTLYCAKDTEWHLVLPFQDSFLCAQNSSVLGGRADWGLKTSGPFLQSPEIISQAAKPGKTSVGGYGWTRHTLVIVPEERPAREEAEKGQVTLFNLLAINSSTCLKLKCSALPSQSSATVKNQCLLSLWKALSVNSPITLLWKIMCEILVKQNPLERVLLIHWFFRFLEP